MYSPVSQIPAASPETALRHYSEKLAFETDCADVAFSMRSGNQDFVLLHVFGSEGGYANEHVPGALYLPHATITAERMDAWPEETLFIVYCAGPHCNGADRAAAALARLGRPVKIMIGGVTGWRDEGLPFATGGEPGGL